MRLLTNLIFEPKGKHDPTLAYAIKDTVMSADGSQVYFALQDVPAGTALTDEDYWKLQIDLSASKSSMDNAIADFANYAKEIGTKVRGETAHAAGNPVTFLPDAGSLLQPVTVLEPQQEGSGDPAPENIRPFIGYDALGLTAAGKNLLPFPYTAGGAGTVTTINGATFTVNADGSITVNGTPTGSAYVRLATMDLGAENITSSETTNATNGTYVLSKMVRYNANNGIVSINLSSGKTYDNVTYYPQVELGTVATSYEPYQGKLHTVQIGQTVYGGKFDWLTGGLVVEWGMKTLNGTEGFEHFSVAEGELFRTTLSGAYSETDIVSDTYATVPRTQRRNFSLYANPSIGGLDIVDSRFTNIDAFKANLAENPVQIAYKLAAPIEIQLTHHIISAADPEQTNTLYGDGSIEVEYVKPLHVSIEERVAAAVQAALATTE